MAITLRSFAKINLGLRIGPARADGYHELRTIYQTIALHDLVTVDVEEGSGIEILCADARVPRNESNTCYKIAERVLKRTPQGLKPGFEGNPYGTAEAVPFQGQIDNHLIDYRSDQSKLPTSKTPGKVVIEIEKRLPVQGGLGAASSNAVATMLGLERALGVQLAASERQRIAAAVGSDLPLFLFGGTVLGVGRGEEVYPLPELPVMHLVVVTPPVGVSTPHAFARWDEYVASQRSAASEDSVAAALTAFNCKGTMNQFSRDVCAWLSESAYPQAGPASGVPAVGGDRAETLLLDLVRTGIENDFERVVFPEYPDLREVKRVLQREGAQYASLSGSGATLYGVFATGEEAEAAAARMRAAGQVAVATWSLTREEYWQQIWRE